MSILIIHGDNVTASRDYYLSQKKQFANQLEFTGSDLSYAQLVQAVSTPNLFGEYPAIFIDSFFSRRPSNEKKRVLEWLNKCSNVDDVTISAIYLYESHDVSAQLKSFDAKFIKYFPYPKYIYSFLETFSLKSLDECLKTDPPELVLAALAKHLHNLILAKENAGSFPSWQLSKLKTQAHKYQLSQLIEFSGTLLKIDYSQKTSTSPMGLKSALELWCLKT